MAVVFVSHSSKDRQTASALVEVLRLALNLTSDEILFSGDIRTGLAPAEPIQERLRAQLRLAPVVLAVVSEQSFTSTYQLLEMGAAWGLQPPDRPGPLIVALTSGRLTSQLRSPLNEAHTVSLDDRAGILALLRELSGRLTRPLTSQVEWEGAVHRLVDVAVSARRRTTAVRLARVVATWLLFSVLVLNYVVERTHVRAQFYEEQAEGLIPISSGCVYLDGDELGRQVDERGFVDFRFANGLPWMRHVRFEHNCDATNPKASGEARWLGPYPFQSLLKPTLTFFFSPGSPANRRLRTAEKTGIGVAYAAGLPSPVETQSTAGAAASGTPPEAGLLVESVSVRALPGWLRKPSRAWFRLTINGAVVSDREVLVRSPLTLGNAMSFFPVGSIEGSWIPVAQGSSTRFKGLLCRLPDRYVRKLSRDDTLMTTGPMKLTLVGDTGAVLGEFDLGHAFRQKVGSSVKVSDTSTGADLIVRPVLEIGRNLDVEWSPNRLTAKAGAAYTLTARLQQNSKDYSSPFEVEVPLQVKGRSTTRQTAAALTFRPGSSSATMTVTPTAGEGAFFIESTLPRSLGGSVDDIHIVVR